MISTSPFVRWTGSATDRLGIRCGRCRRPVERMQSQTSDDGRALLVTVECHGARETVVLDFDMLTAPGGGRVVVEPGVAFAGSAPLPAPGLRE